MNKAVVKIRKRFYWATCKYDVEDWCRSCQIYMTKKDPSKKGKFSM